MQSQLEKLTTVNVNCNVCIFVTVSRNVCHVIYEEVLSQLEKLTTVNVNCNVCIFVTLTGSCNVCQVMCAM